MERVFLVLCLCSISSVVSGRLMGEGIVGGEYAIEEQFPYQVSIQIDPREHWCGGGILSERYILTAAHCVVDHQGYFYPFDYKVVANETDLNISEKGKVVDVGRVYVLNSFRPPLHSDDIAVLELESEVDLREGLRKLELPRTDEDYAGQVARIAGYGWNSIPVYIDPQFGGKYEGVGQSDNKLKYLNVNVLSNAECRQKNKGQIIYDSNVCGQAAQRHINGQLEGVCSGDSGGLLVINNTVIGIVSTSPTGCKENLEAAPYTRVSSFVQFIDSVMNNVQSDDIRVREILRTRGHRIGSRHRHH